MKKPKNYYKELARRRLEGVRQKVARLNTKEGYIVAFADFAGRWLEKIGGRLKPSTKFRREEAIKQLKPYFAGTVRAITESRVKDWAARRLHSVIAII